MSKWSKKRRQANRAGLHPVTVRTLRWLHRHLGHRVHLTFEQWEAVFARLGDPQLGAWISLTWAVVEYLRRHPDADKMAVEDAALALGAGDELGNEVQRELVALRKATPEEYFDSSSEVFDPPDGAVRPYLLCPIVWTPPGGRTVAVFLEHERPQAEAVLRGLPPPSSGGEWRLVPATVAEVCEWLRFQRDRFGVRQLMLSASLNDDDDSIGAYVLDLPSLLGGGKAVALFERLAALPPSPDRN
jgi:hypothetical protein